MLVTIATFRYPHEAHLVKVQLGAMDIPAFVADEHTINTDFRYSNALGGVRLQVPSEFVAEAQAVLNAPTQIVEDFPEADFGPDEPSVCPRCGSSALSAPYTVGQRWAILGVLTWMLVGAPLWRTRLVRKCHDCGKVSKAY